MSAGRAWVFGDDINTDLIAPARYLKRPIAEFAVHTMEAADPQFAAGVQHGDILVGGENFGCGSSREQAPMAIKYAGISAVLAKSFARIFYRNCFNLGLPAIEVDTDQFDEGDELEVDLDNGVIRDKTKNLEFKIAPLPKTMQTLLADGGLVEHFKKHGGFKL